MHLLSQTTPQRGYVPQKKLDIKCLGHKAVETEGLKRRMEVAGISLKPHERPSRGSFNTTPEPVLNPSFKPTTVQKKAYRARRRECPPSSSYKPHSRLNNPNNLPISLNRHRVGNSVTSS